MTSVHPAEANSDEHEVPVSQARSHMAELIEEVRDGETVYLTYRGKRVAALVPADIAENYAQIEDDYWARRAADVLNNDEEAVPWDQALAQLEVDDGKPKGTS